MSETVFEIIGCRYRLSYNLAPIGNGTCGIKLKLVNYKFSPLTRMLQRWDFK